MFFRMKPWNRFSILALILFFSSIFGTTSLWAASDEEKRVTQLIEGAKKEKTLSIYTNTNIPSIDPIIKAYEKKYPFIKTTVYRTGAPRLMPKIMAEARAQRYEFDVVETEGITGYLMTKEGVFAKYDSPERKAFLEGTKDPEGYWTSVYSNFKVIGYSTRAVPPKDVPKSWEDILQPKWKGKMLFSDNNYEWFGNMLEIWGQKKGMAFMKSMAGQNLQYRVGNTVVAMLLAAGESYLSVACNADMIESFKAKGAPIDWVGVEPVISRLHPLAVALKAPHPNAARLYIDFTLSKEGQTLVSKTDRNADRPGVEPFAARFAEPMKLYPADLKLALTYDEIRAQFDKIFIKSQRKS